MRDVADVGAFKGRSRSLTLSVATAALFAACAVPLGNYTKAGVTREQFTRDSYECERDMRYLPPQEKSHWWIGDAAAKFYERCMRAKGYSRVE